MKELRDVPAEAIPNYHSAKQWVEDLFKAGLLFHFDDDPAEILNENNNQLFAPDACQKIRGSLIRLFEEADDPYELAIKCLESQNKTLS